MKLFTAIYTTSDDPLARHFILVFAPGYLIGTDNTSWIAGRVPLAPTTNNAAESLNRWLKETGTRYKYLTVCRFVSRACWSPRLLKSASLVFFSSPP